MNLTNKISKFPQFLINYSCRYTADITICLQLLACKTESFISEAHHLFSIFLITFTSL